MTRKENAWNNALIIYSSCEYKNKDLLNPKQFRLCYLCKIRMNHGTHCDFSTNKKCWNIDHVDGNNSNNNPKNLVATHRICNEEKENKNTTRKYNDAKNKEWCES